VTTYLIIEGVVIAVTLALGFAVKWIIRAQAMPPGPGAPAVSTTQAAVPARLKVTYPSWMIVRSQPDGALTASRRVGETEMISVYAPDPEALENRLIDHEQGSRGKKADREDDQE
jgi:hypothetical protein